MTCGKRLEEFFAINGVRHETHQHPVAYTAQAVAELEHIPHRLMAKVVVVVADGELVMLVLPTSHRVDLVRVRELLQAREVRLATESELAAAFPDCEIGALPPFGNLYQMPVYVDETLQSDSVIYFQAGTHTTAWSISFIDFMRLAKPALASFANTQRKPAMTARNDIKEMGAW